MTISGIVLACRPEHLAETREALGAFAWAEVHYEDPAGRMVVTIDAAGVDESKERLESLQRLPRVLTAELAEYVIENDEDGAAPGPETMRRKS